MLVINSMINVAKEQQKAYCLLCEKQDILFILFKEISAEIMTLVVAYKY